MLVLSIETATKNCSVALFENDKLLGFKEENEGFSHAEKLHQFIDELIKSNGYTYNDLKAIAISTGPGSYTGLRIGLSTAKGLCFALNIPLISVSTLENMAHAAKKQLIEEKSADLESKNFLYCPMIDARRMEVYAMLLDQNLEVIESSSAVIVDKDEKWLKVFKEKNIVYFGDGALKCKPILDEYEGNTFLESQFSFTTAKSMGEIISKKVEQGEFEDSAYFEPNYLKEFLATTPKKLL